MVQLKDRRCIKRVTVSVHEPHGRFVKTIHVYYYAGPAKVRWPRLWPKPHHPTIQPPMTTSIHQHPPASTRIHQRPPSTTHPINTLPQPIIHPPPSTAAQ